MGNLARYVLPMALVLFAVFFLAFNPLPESGYGASSDEGYYAAYGEQVANKGLAGFGDLVNWYTTDPQAKLHPAPVRVGYIGMIATLFHTFGPSLSIIGFLSFLFFLAFLAVNALYLRRFFGAEAAALILMLLATSPLLMGMSRRALPDTATAFFWAAALWSFLEYCRSQRPQALIVLGCTLSMGILFKESTIALVVILPVLAYGVKTFEKRPDISLRNLGLTLGVSTGVSLAIIMGAIGGVGPVLKAVEAMFVTHTVVNSTSFSAYSLLYCSGPWHRFLIDFMLISPVLVILALIYFGQIFIHREKELWIERLLAAFFIIVYAFYNIFPHTKSLRYVAVLEIVLAIFAVRALQLCCRGHKEGASSYLPALAVILLALLNLTAFQDIFFVPGLLDPLTYFLGAVQNFFPLR